MMLREVPSADKWTDRQEKPEFATSPDDSTTIFEDKNADEYDEYEYEYYDYVEGEETEEAEELYDPFGAEDDTGPQEQDGPNISSYLNQVKANRDVQPYSVDEIDARVYIKKTADKGRCMYTRYDLKPGDVVFVEKPTLSAVPELDPELWQALQSLHEEDPLDLPPVWHLAAIYSLLYLPANDRRVISEKWCPDADKDPSPDVLRVIHRTDLQGKVDAKKYEQFINCWRYNCFGHHTVKEGIVLFNRISFLSHSCASTATWHYGPDDSFVLRARMHLKAGDELTITYIGDEELMRSTPQRRERLQGWLFTCNCARCDEVIDKARGFRCPSCGSGTCFITSNVNGTEETVTACSACGWYMDETQVQQFLEFEQAYIQRLDETNTDDLEDAEKVFAEAQRVFTDHWVLYQLNVVLFTGYKTRQDWDAAIHHQRLRAEYAVKVAPWGSYTLAWIHEELGDCIANTLLNDFWENVDDNFQISAFHRNNLTRCYETSMNMLLMTCGDAHEYTLTAHWKMERIMGLPAKT